MTLRRLYKLIKLRSSSGWYLHFLLGCGGQIIELTTIAGTRAGESECILFTEGSRGRDLAFNGDSGETSSL